MYRILQKYAIKAARLADQMGQHFDLALLIGPMEGELATALEKQYIKTAEFFGRDFFQSLKSHVETLEKKDAEGNFLRSIRGFVSGMVERRKTQIAGTTLKTISNAVTEAINNSFTNREMAKLIERRAGGVIAANRAKVIARTETHSAAQFARTEAAKATGLEFRKFWVAADDERTRESHVEAEADSRANIIKMDDAFSVGGHAAQFPGDPGLPVEEIVNCRCQSVQRVILD
ncbi:MAG: hypothetical protein JRC86_02890 [Deltaproteobacteria bacterium]|nr:hypothetical protein [Deltaproteobacteria bacterium]